MGCWLRRCSSICPSTSCGMGQGSYQGPGSSSPGPPQGCARHRAQGRPSAAGTAWCPHTQIPSTAVPPQAHLDAASQDAARQLLVEPGELLTLRHQLQQGRRQRRHRAVLFQGLGQSLVGAHVAHHHHTVLAGTAQAVQEANHLLQHLLRRSPEQTGHCWQLPGPPAAGAAAPFPSSQPSSTHQSLARHSQTGHVATRTRTRPGQPLPTSPSASDTRPGWGHQRGPACPARLRHSQHSHPACHEPRAPSPPSCCCG